MSIWGSIKNRFRGGGEQHYTTLNLNNREQNPTPPEQTTQTPEQGSQAPQQRPAQNSERKNRRAPESARRTAERRAELERQQAETENLAVKERREKAIQAAKDAIEKAEAILASGQLTDTERKNCQWAIKSAKAAYEQSLAQSRDTYTVKAIEAGTNRVIAEREEGMPVDGILGVLEQTRQKLEHKRDIKDQAGLSYQRYRLKISEVDEQSKSEEEKKLAWHSAFHEILPAGHFLRKEAEKMVAQWERADSRQYSEAEKKLQLGEALKQVLVREGFVEKSVNGKIVSKDVVVANPEELASLKKIVDILTKESKKYFDYHRTQGHEQHPFTHRESDFVAKDPQYRAVLLKKYTDQNEIPANFGQMTKLDQDYLLAELAVRDRRVLDLPKEVAVPEKALPKTIFRINISELAKRMAQTLADARLDQHYEEAKGIGGWFKRRGRALSEKWTRLELYDEALKEIMENQDLLKAMEGRSLVDSKLAGEKAKVEGKKAKLSRKEIGQKVEQAKAGAKHKATVEDYYELIDSVVEEYHREVINNDELGENLQVSDALNAEMAKLLVAHQRGQFADRNAFEAHLKGNAELQRLLKAETEGKKFSSDAEKQKQAGELLFAGNFWQIAEGYKAQVGKLVQEYTTRCVGEGREVNEAELMAHVKGAMAFDLQLGIKDRDLANNKPDEFLKEYEKYKSGTGAFKLFQKGGATRILFNPFTYGMVAGAGGGLVGRAVGRTLANKGTLLGLSAAGVGTFASFGVPIAIGAGFGAYYAYKKRREQATADVRHAQRYEALGGQLSSVLDERRTGLLKGKHELRTEFTKNTAEAITNMERMLALETLTDEDKKELAGICARLEIKADKIADLFELDEESGKKYSSTQKADSRLKILRAELEEKFGLSGAQWEQLIGQERGGLIKDAEQAEKNIKDFIKYEATKSGVMGGVAGAAGALVGQKLSYMGMEWLSNKLGLTKCADYFTHHATTWDRATAYWSGDTNKDLALFPLETPYGSAISKANLIEQAGISGKGFQTKNFLPEGFSLKPISSNGGVDRVSLINGDGKSFGLFDINKDNGKIVPVSGTVSTEINLTSTTNTIEVAGRGGKITTDEWLSSIKGKIPGGGVEKIHTRSWYSNPDLQKMAEGQYVDKPNVENELKFFVNRDSTSGDLRLKVPVTQGGSWRFHGKEFIPADIDKAFSDGKIKMIFAPGGNSSEAIVLDVDPKTHEVILPKDSPLQALWDPTTNRFKGKGYFGLAEAVGNKADGSKDYIWINSDRGNGQVLDFGGGDGGDKQKISNINYTFERNIYIEGKGNDMPLTPAYWRRKIYNKYRSENQQLQSDVNRQDSTSEAVSSEMPLTNELDQRPELTREQATTMTDQFIAVAKDPSKTDDEVLVAARQFHQNGTQFKISGNLSDEMSEKLASAPAPAGDRIHRALEILNQETLQNKLGRMQEALINSTNHRVHFEVEGEQLAVAEQVSVMDAFTQAWGELAQDKKNALLAKANASRAGGQLATGLIIGFPKNIDRLNFDNRDRLVFPANATKETIKTFLETAGNPPAQPQPAGNPPRGGNRGGGGH